MNMDVVCDFRSADVASGGQGAPLLPLYHRALVRSSGMELPAVILNIGGVANITYVGAEGKIMAFDTGPGNALLTILFADAARWLFDRDGMLAASGSINQDVLMQWLGNPYFSQKPPKSLDRNSFDISSVSMLSDEEGAATLTAFAAFAVRKALDLLPEKTKGNSCHRRGQKNFTMMTGLAKITGLAVRPVDEVGFSGDAMEAEGFVARSRLGLPLSLPETTGVSSPISGGKLFKAEKKK